MKAKGDSKERRAVIAMAALARDSAAPSTRDELAGGLHAVRRRIDAERRSSGASARRALLRWSAVGSVAAAAALAGIGLVRSGYPPARSVVPALDYRVEGGDVGDGGFLRESGHAGIKLLFNEGTEFVLMPGTRSRLREVGPSGARIAIEHGAASFQVTPSPSIDRRWQVDVGPFLVTVKGTVFTVSWDAATGKFELKLRHGRVTVKGPLNGGEIGLQTGQRLAVDVPRGETVIVDQDPDEWLDSGRRAPPPETPRPERPSTRVAGSPPHPGRAASVSSEPKFDRDRGWAGALAAGRLDAILAEAEGAGVRSTLAKASIEDLLALADAARYRRRMDLAREALLAVRVRFPDSPHSVGAAFRLGRVEEASEDGLTRAIKWYDEYLTRAPTGAYASEALGRKLTLTRKLQGSTSARPIAEEYLRRFPTGSYAGAARTFLRSP